MCYMSAKRYDRMKASTIESVSEKSCWSEICDSELAARTAAGSVECFAELVNRHGGRLLGFLTRRSGETETAEDLTQETFVRAFERIESYDPRWAFTTWLFTIGSRLAISKSRKKRPGQLDRLDHIPSTGDEPSAILAEREDADGLWSLAERELTDDQFTAIWLFYVESMSVREISHVMGRTKTSIKVILFRARARLARALSASDKGGS